VVARWRRGALLVFVFKDREFRASFDHVLGGAVVGPHRVGGWYVTGHLGFGENPQTLEDTSSAPTAAHRVALVSPRRRLQRSSC
jgi:hypothetical protein